LLFDIEDDGADTLGVLLGRKTHYEKMDIGLAIIPTPFSPETLVAAGRGMVWVGDSETPTIRGFRVDQRDEVAMVQSPFDVRSISRSDRSRTQEAYAEHYSRSRYARSLEFPDQMPRFEQLKVDRLGNLWVQEYEPFWAEGDQHWAVFSTGGRQLADVTIPPNAIPPCARKVTRSCNVLTGIFEIGSDYILVPQTDEWGVRYVRKFNIQKPSDMMSGRSER
jgi:hypothetical protein